MITEDYVSFEVAKLLKEKGFDEKCMSYYGHGKFHLGNQEYIKSNTDRDGVAFNGVPYDAYNAPSLQMAMKWLREKHNLHISVLITYQYFPRKYEVHIMHTEKYEDIVVNPGTNFNTNEEACESAIRYTLENLI
jgi:hypothetical protein